MGERISSLLKTTYPAVSMCDLGFLIWKYARVKRDGLVERAKLLAAKHSTPICEMFRGRECVVRIAFGASDVKGAFSLHRVLLRLPSALVAMCGEEDLLVSPILSECAYSGLAGRCRFSQHECLSLSFLSVYLPSPQDEIVSFSEKYVYRRALKSP